MALLGWLIRFTICSFGSRKVLELSILSPTKASTEPRLSPVRARELNSRDYIYLCLCGGTS